jgi:hypothetical protein
LLLFQTQEVLVNTRISAVQYLRPFRGGAQAHLLRASDGNWYVTKFQNNPQHIRVLANEMLATLFGIHELRRAERAGPDGSTHPQVIVGVTQQREINVGDQSMKFYGGATLVIDLKRAELKYAIRKRIDNKQREQDTKAFLKKNLENPLTALLLNSDRHDRFAILHALADMED